MLQGETVGGQILTGLDKCAIISFIEYNGDDEEDVGKRREEAEKKLQEIVGKSKSFVVYQSVAGAGGHVNGHFKTVITIFYTEKDKE